MATLDDNSIDAIVCDPPYELGFMGKAWDNSGIAYDVTVWQQCLRVLKPGGHLVAFGGSRTYHRLAVAIEDAGFEIRDQIQWIYGSGFPKSLDVSKAMDKQAGATREVVTEVREDMFGEYEAINSYKVPDAKKVNPHFISSDENRKPHGDYNKSYYPTAPSTDLAKQWQGWGTALKPAHEPAVLARKPLCGTVADNVMTWGVGALNIDGTRVNKENDRPLIISTGRKEVVNTYGGTLNGSISSGITNLGRWPANVILDEDAAKALDEQGGERKSGGGNKGGRNDTAFFGSGSDYNANYEASTGGASRFFYTAKASKAEREAGLYYEEWVKGGGMKGTEDGTLLTGSGNERNALRANHHPTVKPLSLMRYLVRLVTPPGGTVLDPFMGSGSTGCAAVLEGFDFVGIDITPEYVAIAEKRIAHYAVKSPLEGI
jgi:site-specific DNA-methyltransferase (adenine-specific)